MKNKGEVALAILVTWVVVAFGFTVVDGVAKQQWNKIKDAHNAEITVDNEIPWNRGFAR